MFGTTASSLQLNGCLYGHTDVVTCLAASDSFNLIVSGGRDCTCIVWDLRYLIFLRQLGASSGGTAYKAPVAALCISEATGDIAVCAGAWLYLWSITGDLVACLNTAPDQSNQIYCVAMSTVSTAYVQFLWLHLFSSSCGVILQSIFATPTKHLVSILCIICCL